MRDLADAPEPLTIPDVRLSANQSVSPSSWPGVQNRIDIPLWVLLVVAMGLGAAGGFGWLTLANAAAGAVLVSIWPVLAWIVGLQARRRREAAWTASRFGSQPLTWRFSAEGIEQTGPYMHLTVPWSDFFNANLTTDGYVFALTPSSVLLLPTEGLTQDQKAAVGAWFLWARRDGGPMDDPS